MAMATSIGVLRHEISERGNSAERQSRLAYLRRRNQASAYTQKPEVRERIFFRDNYRCVQCSSVDKLTIDHIVSIYRGGSDKDENLQTLCNRCNARKAP